MSRDFKVAIIVLMPLVVGIAVYVPFNAGGRERLNMAAAREEIPRIQAILDADIKFKDVKTFVYTGQGGAVALVGTMEKKDDLFQLMKAVAAERLPVVVSWQVHVLGDSSSAAGQ